MIDPACADVQATQIDIQHRLHRMARERQCAGPVGGQDGFEIVSGRSAHELARVVSEEVRHGARIGTFDGFAGQDQGATVHVLRY